MRTDLLASSPASADLASTDSAASKPVAFLAPHARPSRFRRWVLEAFRPMTRGHLRLELPDGEVHEFGAPGGVATLPLQISAAARLNVKHEVFFKRCVLGGDIGFAESYLDGEWETPNLTAVIAFFIHNVDQAPTLSGSANRAIALNLLRGLNRLTHLLRRNTRRIARRNIGEHYDLSNEFFALWLDPSMMYSSGRWPAQAPELSLEEAQHEKNDALCRSLQLSASDHVLEIGTGWGGWSLHAARKYGCRVTSLTISEKQHALARQRIAEAGLSERIDVQLCDYRDVRGRFDKLVSIEMMEAIGHRYLPAFCATIARVLKPDGIAALQFITCPDARYEEFRRGVDFIQKHIFPGSLLLSLNRVNTLLSRAGSLMLHRLDDLGHDYARTLRLWHERFRAQESEIRALGFDERFLRKWSYYLCYCEAAFALRNISVVQAVYSRANNLALTSS